MKRLRITVVVALAVAMIGGTAAVVRADNAEHIVPQPATTYVYAAKFLCGEFDKFADPKQPAMVEGPVKPGNYQTVINVHNPHFTTVNLRDKAVMLFYGDRALPQHPFQVPKPPGPLKDVSLKSDWGFYVDCTDIRTVLLAGIAPAAPMLIEGWFVIYSPALIDVETVVTSYTYNMVNQNGIVSFQREGFDTELERVQPTRVNNLYATTGTSLP